MFFSVSLCLHQTLLLVRCVHRTAASRLRRTATFWSSLWSLSEPWLWWWWWWWPWSAHVALQLSRGSRSLTGQMIHVATVVSSLDDDVLNVSSHKPHGWFTSWLWCVCAGRERATVPAKEKAARRTWGLLTSGSTTKRWRWRTWRKPQVSPHLVTTHPSSPARTSPRWHIANQKAR